MAIEKSPRIPVVRSFCAMNLPTVVPQELICPFAYYWRGEIRTGMMLNGQIYDRYSCFAANRRQVAYELGERLMIQVDVVMTVSWQDHEKYQIWLNLATLEDVALLGNGGSLDQAALAQIASNAASAQAMVGSRFVA